jgi:hypothetical protein
MVFIGKLQAVIMKDAQCGAHQRFAGHHLEMKILRVLTRLKTGCQNWGRSQKVAVS